MSLTGLRSMLMAFLVALVVFWVPLWWFLSHGPTQEQQLDTLQSEIGVLKTQIEADKRLFESRVAGMTKELNDIRKNLGLQKTLLLKAKGQSLNADQNIQQAVETAVKAEPVKPIKSEAELLERARLVGLKSVVIR